MTQDYIVPRPNFIGFLNVFLFYGIPGAILTPGAEINGQIKVKITVPNKIHKSQLDDLQTTLNLPPTSEIFNT